MTDMILNLILDEVGMILKEVDMILDKISMVLEEIVGFQDWMQDVCISQCWVVGRSFHGWRRSEWKYLPSLYTSSL